MLDALTTHAASYAFTIIDVPYPATFQTTPTGINDRGQIAGFYLDFGLTSHGFLLSHGNFSSFDFTTPSCCTDFWGINSRGQIVGYGGNVGFLFMDGQFSTVVVPGSNFTSAQGINDSGEIVGDAIVADEAVGFLLTGDGFSLIRAPGARSTRALGINDSGHIVGTAETHGYLLRNGVFSTIDFPGAVRTVPTGINNVGEIVGWYEESPSMLHGFIMNQEGISTIDFPGSTSTQVFGINNRGEIVGVMADSSGSHGFMAKL
jgi:uncharacterized membrane protein